jgi:hypothetical protein
VREGRGERDKGGERGSEKMENGKWKMENGNGNGNGKWK